MTTRHTHKRVRWLAAAGLTVSVFLLYLATLSPGVAMWDAGEYVAAAASLGIPHPPGNPLFILIAHVAGLIPFSDVYAVRINVLAAAASAVAAGFWFLCAERLLRTILPRDAHRLVAAASASLLGATAFTVWNQSVVMEKVYPISLAALALTSWLVLVWLDSASLRGEEKRADRVLILIAYLTGLAYAIHPAGLLTAPATAVAVLAHRPATIRRWRLMAILGAAFFVGTSPFAVLPIRAAHQPYVNEGAASACEDGTIAAACTFSAETAGRLKAMIEREQYGGNAVIKRRGPLSAQFGMFWLYFRWQWFRDLGGSMWPGQSIAAAAMLILGLVGLGAMRRRDSDRSPAETAIVRHADRAHVWYFGALALTFTVLLVYYLNQRYGFSQRMDLADTVAREPRDRDYFFMWTFSLWGLLAGVGLASLTKRLRPRVAMLALAAVVLVPLGANWHAASRTGQDFTTAWARDMLNSLEPNAIIITNGDNDSFPLWYAQAVENVRRDVTVTLVPYLGIEWYGRQLNRRGQLWDLTDEELDSVPQFFETRPGDRFEHGALSAAMPSAVMTRDQLLVLRAIKDSFPERPVYFSTGGYFATLGLDPYVKCVGLVNRLMSEPVRENADTVRIGGQWVDIPRSLELWNDYEGARQLVREGRWVDNGSAQIPLYYAAVGQQLAIALDARGQREEALGVIGLVEDVVDVLR